MKTFSMAVVRLDPGVGEADLFGVKILEANCPVLAKVGVDRGGLFCDQFFSAAGFFLFYCTAVFRSLYNRIIFFVSI